ncbi:hypothetical protein ACLI1A_16315 [Flavobacterium sp. RHBU_3]|uniref:hypothetical protein n=1 Tax=Flavobacterium sp. RHBU_3 TaxID=3391184 RepID=UPI0039855BAC
MKKIVLLFAAFGLLTMTSCNNDDDNNYDQDTVAQVIETNGINFNSSNSFSQLITFDSQLYPYDMVLVYRQGYDSAANVAIWELTPRNYNFDNGDIIGYDFNFTQNDVELYMLANFDLTLASGTYTQNQVFRIVIIPGSLNGQGKKSVNYKDYNAVMKAYGLTESNVTKLK